MTDRQTDRQTDGRTDARGKTICLPTLSGGDIMTQLSCLSMGRKHVDQLEDSWATAMPNYFPMHYYGKITPVYLSETT